MSRYLRPRIPGATIFFTVNLADRGADTLLRHVGLLRQAVAEARTQRWFQIDAWVVLPDHMHCVWTLPEGDADYSVRMAAIKARFTRSLTGNDGRVGFHPTTDGGHHGPRGSLPCLGGVEPHPTINGVERHLTINGRARSKSKVMKGDGRVWQRRFWEHHIRGDEDFAACVRYCWINPVKHGFVARPEDWPWSSYRRDMARGGSIP